MLPAGNEPVPWPEGDTHRAGSSRRQQCPHLAVCPWLGGDGRAFEVSPALLQPTAVGDTSRESPAQSFRMVPLVLGGRCQPCSAWEPHSWDQVPLWAGVPGRDSAQTQAAQWGWQSCVIADRDSPASAAVVMAAVTHIHLRPRRVFEVVPQKATLPSMFSYSHSGDLAFPGALLHDCSPGPSGPPPEHGQGARTPCLGPSPLCRAALHPHYACCEPGQSPCNGAGPHLLLHCAQPVTQAASHSHHA